METDNLLPGVLGSVGFILILFAIDAARRLNIAGNGSAPPVEFTPLEIVAGLAGLGLIAIAVYLWNKR